MPRAITISLTSTLLPGTVAGAFVQLSGGNGSASCDQAAQTACSVVGYAGTYQLPRFLS
jgi:hypothetical protein